MQTHNEKTGQRPGAMTVAMQAVQHPRGPSGLRVGVIRGGRIVEDRILRAGEAFVVGSAVDASLVLQSFGVARATLLRSDDDGYVLHEVQDVTGRVGLGASVYALTDALSLPSATGRPGARQVRLPDQARGRLQVGDVTLLFQVVECPPVQPKPQLPAVVKTRIAAGVDWMFSSFVAMSLLGHLAFVVYMQARDWPVDPGLSRIPPAYESQVFEASVAPRVIEPPPPPPDPVDGPAPSDGQQVADRPRTPTPDAPSRPRVPDTSRPSPTQTPQEVAARMADEAARQAEALLVGALAADANGALADVLRSGAPTESAADVLAQAASVGVAGSRPDQLKVRPGGAPSRPGAPIGTLDRTADTGPIAAGDPLKEKAIVGKLDLEDDYDEVGGMGDFDINLVTRTVKRKLGAIKRCYEKQLRRNPTLAGKVTVEFTIVEAGNVPRARAIENTTGDAQVASCVVRTVKRFRFHPGPDGGAVTYAYPFVFAPQR